MAQRRASSSFLLLACLGAVSGCGNTPATMTPTDAGPDAWARADAYLGPDSCDPDHLHMLEGMAGGTVSLDFDTRMTTTRPRDLGPACGNTAADIRWAGQEVIALHVPGTGLQGVQFSTSNTMTDPTFNTLVQVRQGDCRTVPTTAFPPSCFDDASQTDIQSRGGITVMGGSTIYLFVTGYSHPPAAQMTIDEGTVHIDIAISPNTAPVIESGTAIFSGVDTLITATATDPEGPIAGYSIAFYNAMGQIDISGDGARDGNDILTLGFDTVDNAAPSYTGHSFISGTMLYRLAEYCQSMGVNCTQFGLRVFDAQYAVSDELRVDVHNAAVVGLGATCDVEHLCAGGLTCSAGTCVVSPAAMAECAAAQPINIPTPTTGATMTLVSNNIGTGTGVFAGSCAPTPGKENIWSLVIPPGDFDLALTTDVAASGTSDTVLYLRSACADQTTELAMGCNDDINTAGMNYQSSLTFRDIAPGTYYVFVEVFNGAAAASYGLQTTLTPVLPSGAACDPALRDYRCATGSCSATTMTCP